jgi:LacI family transcriptional regulator
LINGNRIAGILFVSYIPKRILEQSMQMGIPALCLNNRHEGMVSIAPEYEKGSYEAIKYLQNLGHKRIGILLGSRHYYSSIERFRGYTAAVFDTAKEILPQYILDGDWTFDGARQAVFKMLETVPPKKWPTAIFCCSDMMAAGAMDALKEKDFSIPKDISIIGFDNVQLSNHVFPRLTTVSIDLPLMARLAVEKINQFNDKANPPGYLIQIPAVLVERRSVKGIS